jgi:hypothetical protein
MVFVLGSIWSGSRVKVSGDSMVDDLRRGVLFYCLFSKANLFVSTRMGMSSLKEIVAVR